MRYELWTASVRSLDYPRAVRSDTVVAMTIIEDATTPVPSFLMWLE